MARTVTTGANEGIGSETARRLVEIGDAGGHLDVLVNDAGIPDRRLGVVEVRRRRPREDPHTRRRQ